MSQTQIEMRATGLFLDPSPHSDVPPGALREASDVVIRRAGIIEPRPGLEEQSAAGVPSDYVVTGVHAFEDSHVLISRDPVTPANCRVASDAGATAVTFGGAQLSFARMYASAAVRSDALFLATEAGVLRLDAADDATVSLAGMPKGRSGYTTLIDGPRTSSRWLTAAGGSVAYRVIFVRRANPALFAVSRRIVGAPSGRFFAEANGAANKAIRIRVPLGSELALGDGVEIYRSETSTASTPSDELALVASRYVNTSDISAGYVDVDDLALEVERGAALYTNATQVGAINEHARPPMCRVVAGYEQMTFYGDCQTPALIAMEWSKGPSADPAAPGVYAADFTSGSPLISSADWTDDIDFIGMAVAAAGGPRGVSSVCPGFTLLESSQGSGDWTLTSNALATSAGETLTLCDWLYLDDDNDTTTFYFLPSGSDDFAAGDIVADAGTDAQSRDRTLSKLAASINLNHPNVVASALGGGSLVIENANPSSTSSINIDVNRRLAKSISPQARGATLATTKSIASTQDNEGHRVMWSRLSIPEGVPPTNFVDVGSSGKRVLAMVSSSRSLLVFKEDGIWRINGRSPETLSVEEVDSSAVLLHPRAVTSYQGQVYAWTNHGVVIVSDTGIISNLSETPLESELRAMQLTLGPDQTTEGAFLSFLGAEGWLMLGVPAALGDVVAEWTYVLDSKTGGWTRWSFTASSMASVSNRLHFGSTGGTWRSRLDTEAYPHHDTTETIDSASSIDGAGSQLTVVASSMSAGLTPSVGDWVVLSVVQTGSGNAFLFEGALRSFDSVTDTFVFDGLLLANPEIPIAVPSLDGFSGSAASGTVYQGPQCAIEWTARTAANPLQTKLWGDAALNFETLDRFSRIDWAWSGDMQDANASEWVRSPDFDRERPAEWGVRGAVVRNAARSSQLFVRATIHNPGAKWLLTSLLLTHQSGAVRSGKRAP